MTDETLSNLLREDRRFPPPAALAEQANVTAAAYEEAAADSEAFWAAQAITAKYIRNPGPLVQA